MIEGQTVNFEGREFSIKDVTLGSELFARVQSDDSGSAIDLPEFRLCWNLCDKYIMRFPWAKEAMDLLMRQASIDWETGKRVAKPRES